MKASKNRCTSMFRLRKVAIPDCDGAEGFAGWFWVVHAAAPNIGESSNADDFPAYSRDEAALVYLVEQASPSNLACWDILWDSIEFMKIAEETYDLHLDGHRVVLFSLVLYSLRGGDARSLQNTIVAHSNRL